MPYTLIYKEIEMKIIIVVTFFLIIDFLPTNSVMVLAWSINSNPAKLFDR